MSQNRLLILGVIGILVIGFVRILERPDAPEDPIGNLFMVEDVDPLLLAACTALQGPLEELFETQFARQQVDLQSEAATGCRLSGRGIEAPSGASPDAVLDALFDTMGWEALPHDQRYTGRAYQREPVTCMRLLMDGQPEDSIDIVCQVDGAERTD